MSVTRKELAAAVCELLCRYYDEGAGEDAEMEALVNKYFAEIGEKATFIDYYRARDAQKGSLKKFSAQFVAEYFAER